MDLESIDPGKLDRRISILYPVNRIDEITNESIKTFSPWAENVAAQMVNQSGGGEDIKGLQNVAQRNTVFIIRYREGINPKFPQSTFQIIDHRYQETYEVVRVEEMKIRRTGWLFYCKIKDNDRP